jgi:hypothetical protein
VGVLRIFWGIFSFWGSFKILYFFYFFIPIKKIMFEPFEQKSDEKTISCMNYGPLCVFDFQNFHVFPAFRIRITILKCFLTLLVIFHLQQLH